MKIIDTNEFEVTKLKTVVKFNIKKNNSSEFFFSVKELLGETKNQFSIKANNIITFNDFIKTENFLYKHAERFFLDIENQINLLESKNYTLLEIKPSDIFYLEIDVKNFIFLILKTDSLVKINDKNIEINQPFNKKLSKYFSPEMKNVTKIPTNISFKSCYYSIAIIIIDSFKKIEKELILETHLSSLCETKLYYALKRCLEENPENRYLLYI